jgi:hypothetical protein
MWLITVYLEIFTRKKIADFIPALIGEKYITLNSNFFILYGDLYRIGENAIQTYM